MGAYFGAGRQLQIAKETVYGTAVIATQIIPLSGGESLETKVDKKEEPSLLVSKSAKAKDIMSVKGSGSIPFVLVPEMAGFIIKAALGGTDSVGTGVPVAGANTHTIILNDVNTLNPSYTLYMDRGVGIKKHTGAKVDSLSIDAKVGDFVTGTLAVKYKDEASGALQSLTLPSLKAYKFQGGSLTIGGTVYDCSHVTFTLSNNLQEVPQTFASGIYANEPINGVRNAKVTFDIPYDANTDTMRTSNYFTDTVATSAVIVLLSPSIVTGSTQYKMTITMNNVVITEHKANVGGSGPIIATVTGEATAVGTTEPLSIAIIDAQATAY